MKLTRHPDPKWRTDIAPKDGRRFLAYENTCEESADVVIVSWWPTRNAFVTDGGDANLTLTHWMPLPSPPAKETP